MAMAGFRCYLPKRYVFVILVHLAVFVNYALRVNFSVTIVAMINSTFLKEHATKIPRTDCEGQVVNNTIPQTQNINNADGEFKWDQYEQGLALSSFFYGYLFTQIPGGYLAIRFGGKWVLTGAMVFSCIFTFLSPIAAKTSLYMFILTRIMLGIGLGPFFPATHSMLAKWARPSEKSRMSVLAYSGGSTGIVLTLPICSMLAESSLKWPATFYVFGILGLLWLLLWIPLSSNSPEQHPFISIKEKLYIVDSLKTLDQPSLPTTVPWAKVFSSYHVWAIVMAHFCHNWVYYLIMTGLPLYFKEVLKFELQQNGFLSALPFVLGFASNISSGFIADFLIKKRFTVTQTRRLIGALAFYPTAVCLILAGFAECGDTTLPVACFVLGTTFLHLNFSGFNINHIDIAPRYAGLLFGITNTLGTVSGCVCPLVTGYFTENQPSRDNYRKVFLLAAGIAVLGGTFFSVFVSGNKQSWNDFSSTDSESTPNHSIILSDKDVFDEAIDVQTDMLKSKIGC